MESLEIDRQTDRHTHRQTCLHEIAQAANRNKKNEANKFDHNLELYINK